MQLTIEIQDAAKLQQLIAVMEKIGVDFWSPKEKPVRVRKTTKKELPIIAGDHSIDPYALVGIWKDNPITLEEIREKAWRTI